MRQNIFRSLMVGLFLFFSIVYLEVLFKIRVLSFSWNGDLIRIVLFSLAYSLLFMFLLKFFKPKTIKVSIYVGISVITFLFLNQEVYSSFVEGFYSVAVIGDFTAGLSFFSDYLTSLKFSHLLYFLPLIVYIIVNRYHILSYELEYCESKHPLYFLISFFVLILVTQQTIDDEIEQRNVTGDEVEITIENVGTLLSYSDKDLFTYMYNSQDALKKFGLLTYTRRDIATMFYRNPLSEEAYEILIDDFLENQPVHQENTYTRLFEDKNFILIMAESLDTYAINETLTPNLYRIKSDYTYFENFYSPLYYRSTADSEFMVQTGMLPDKNVTLSMDAYLHNTFPNTLPTLFETAGYSTYSFHDYTDYFYPRSDFHINTLGYDQFWGSEELGMTTGFDPDRPIFDHVWQSDFEMMKRAVPKFINDDKFFVNILTVSGHFDYSARHEMARPEYVEAVQTYLDGLEEPVEYSDTILYYLAVQMEVDKAIGFLIDELEQADKLDDTVIMIFGDHYAYGINNDDIWAYDDGQKVDEDLLDIHNTPMMMMTPSNFFDGTKQQYMSTIDVLPTISNLFNLPITYQNVFGHDALGTNSNVIRFADGSFLSANFRYDALSEEMVIEDNAVSESYILKLYNKYLNDYMYNLLILQYDYYKKDENP